MTRQTLRLIALLAINSGTIKVIHRLASDMEEIDGRSHYAEIMEAYFTHC